MMGHFQIQDSNSLVFLFCEINCNSKIAYKFENGKRKRIKVNSKVNFNNARVAGAFHGALSLNKQKKISKVLKLLEFPCFDALSYSHLAEGKIDIVLQCGNKIWDIHPLIPIIEAAGGKMADFTKLTIFVTRIENNKQVWKARSEFFRGNFPACSLVEVSKLATPDIYVEIEGIAHIGKGN